MRRALAILALAIVVAGCGSSISKPAATVTVTATAPSGPARVTAAQIAKAFIAYDSVRTKALPAQPSDDCDRLAVNDTGDTYYGAWVVISPSDACDEVLASEVATSNAQRVEENIWIEYDDSAGVETRITVHALTAAAYVVMNYPGSGYGPDS